MKVLFITQEIMPYLPETEMSTICRYLPQGIQEQGAEVRTFMPKFGCVSERRNQLHEVIRLSGMNLIISDTDHPLTIKVASIQPARMQVYFIDNEEFFNRKHTFYDDDGVCFADNDERAIFYARGVLETVRKLRWQPDIIHCHGWFTALVTLYVKKAFREDPLYSKTKVVYSAYNDGHKLSFNNDFKLKVHTDGVTQKDVAVINKPTHQNLNKLAINFADGLVTVGNQISPIVLEHIKNSNKPLIQHDPQTYIKDCANLYNDLLAIKT
jgi:starch synthase